jgi:hypothetical protein
MYKRIPNSFSNLTSMSQTTTKFQARPFICTNMYADTKIKEKVFITYL